MKKEARKQKTETEVYTTKKISSNDPNIWVKMSAIQLTHINGNNYPPFKIQRFMQSK